MNKAWKNSHLPCVSCYNILKFKDNVSHCFFTIFFYSTWYLIWLLCTTWMCPWYILLSVRVFMIYWSFQVNEIPDLLVGIITFLLLQVNVMRDLKPIIILTISFQENCPNKLKFKGAVMQVLFWRIWFSAVKWLIHFQLRSA